MKQTLLTLALVTPLAAGLAYAMSSALAMPDVHFSYATGECVKVVNYTDENFSCENYPSKFNHVWVQ
jgi:hypothetical protein